MCGRDRNLLATLAHLLGAHDLGVRNLVVITGDPPKMGDFPDATAVYDLDSIGILKLATRLNHGVDPGGKPLGATTRFLLATGAEPAALNYEREIARLKDKKAAGAELVMTQPVYSPEVLDRFLDDVAPLGLPVLVGLLPLASHRNAEFLHNEVPGMQVPEAIRERMRKAGSGAAARKEGVAIAREMLGAVRGRVAGAYVMPPLRAPRARARGGGRLSGPAMKLALAAGFALVLAMPDLLAGCHRATLDMAAGPPDAATAAASDAQDALLPARCKKTDVAFALDQGRGLADLEIGDGIAYPGGFAVGLVHHAAAGRVAAVALLRRDPVGLTRVLDLGPTIGDAPPPRIGWRAGELVAAAFAPNEASPEGGTPSARTDATRDVAIYSLADGAAAAAPPLSVPQRRDDSLALDLAFAGPAGLLVWDEATSAPRGVVKAASFTRDHAGAAHDVSPPDSDAELPSVVAQGGGFAVVWIARRPEPASALDGSPNEATGEARAFGWLEMAAVDAQGQPAGAVRRLTPATGHVSAYDVATLPASGGGAPSFLVVARDDGEAIDGSGGALLRLRVTGDGAEPPVVVATEGLGRGAPSFVSGVDTSARRSPRTSGARAFVGGQGRASPAPSSRRRGRAPASPSSEDALDDARALLFTGGHASGPTTSDVLVAAPSDSAAQLRIYACAR